LYFKIKSKDVVLDLQHLIATLRLQSKVESQDTIPEADTSESGLVSFDNQVEGQDLSIATNLHIDRSIQPKNIELAKFLSRPVPIATYTWGLGTSFRYALSPWFLFMNQTSIKKRLDNYHLFKGNLHLKFMINASPFYYGCTMIYYRPDLDIPSTTVSENTLPITASQLPRVFIYPANSAGATMTLPFIYHKEWVNLTSATDVTNLGTLFLQDVVGLRTASTSTKPITLTIYAWLEDYQLSGPTFELSLQSGVSDEYGDGIVSKPSSAIARAAGMLEDIPVIGQFATATRIGASAISSVAKLFGFTNVPVIDDVHALIPEAFPHMASTDIGAAMNKLTLDSKNELSIDSTIIGADVGDELNIKHLVSRETLITDFDWQTSDNPGDRLFNIRVTPDIKNVSEQLTTYTIDPTPMWLVQRMFLFWRGDIEYRFKIICSQYHRGRLRFSWSPNGSLGTVSNTTTEVLTKIVDIAETTDFTIRIPYMQPAAYLETGTSVTVPWDDVNPVSPVPLNTNGILTIRVLNELTAPVDTATVTILVFARGADNLEFSAPQAIDPQRTLSPFNIQSGVSYDGEDEDETGMIIQTIPTNPNINLIYGGETVSSLRVLLRRPSKYRTTTTAGTLSAAGILGSTLFTTNRLPIAPGFDPNGINTAIGPVSGTAKPYNWVTFTPISFIGQCFLATRGSVIYYFDPLNASLTCEMGISRPGTFTQATSATYLGVNTQATTANAAVAHGVTNMRDAQSGRAMVNNRTKSGVTAVVPFYSKFKFRGYDPFSAVLGSTSDFSFVDNVQFDVLHTPASSINVNSQYGTGNCFNFYISAGTDFTFNFFLFVPRMYIYKATPAP